MIPQKRTTSPTEPPPKRLPTAKDKINENVTKKRFELVHPGISEIKKDGQETTKKFNNYETIGGIKSDALLNIYKIKDIVDVKYYRPLAVPHDLKNRIINSIEKGTLNNQFAYRIIDYYNGNYTPYKINNNGEQYYIGDNVYKELDKTVIEFAQDNNIDPKYLISNGAMQGKDLLWIKAEMCIVLMNFLFGSANWKYFLIHEYENNAVYTILSLWLYDGTNVTIYGSSSSIFGKAINKYNINNAAHQNHALLLRHALGNLFRLFKTLNDNEFATEATKELKVNFRQDNSINLDKEIIKRKNEIRKEIIDTKEKEINDKAENFNPQEFNPNEVNVHSVEINNQSVNNNIEINDIENVIDLDKNLTNININKNLPRVRDMNINRERFDALSRQNIENNEDDKDENGLVKIILDNENENKEINTMWIDDLELD